MIVGKQISYNMEICDTKTRVSPDTGVCASRRLECGVWLALTQFYGIQVITFMLNKLEIRSQIQFYFSKTHNILSQREKKRGLWEHPPQTL